MFNRQNITVLLLGLIAGTALSLGSGVMAQREKPADLPTDELRTFTEVFDRIKQNYVEEVDAAPPKAATTGVPTAKVSA